MHIPDEITDPTHPVVTELVERQYAWRWRYRYPDATSAREAAGAAVRELLPGSRLLQTEAGVLWLGPDEEFTFVYDVWARDPGQVATQVAELRALAGRLAGAPLMAGLLPGEPSREAFIGSGDFVLSGTTMRLDVTEQLPAESLRSRVELISMTDDKVAGYRARAVTAYAHERQAAGESADLARRTSEASFEQLLPGGRPGPDQYLFTVRHSGQPAGWLWVCRRWPAQGWVYDVAIDAALRGQGLGAAAMVHAAAWARGHGLTWLGLNVFGQNTHARSLYERLGYRVEESYWGQSPSVTAGSAPS